MQEFLERTWIHVSRWTSAVPWIFTIMAAWHAGSHAGEAREIEERLNRTFTQYQEAHSTLEFDYRVDQYPDHYEITMIRGRVGKVITYWKYRNRTKFEEFVTRLGRLASHMGKMDVRVFVKDDKAMILESYLFTLVENRLKEVTGGFSRFDMTIRTDYPLTCGQLEQRLEEKYDTYTNEQTLFLFEYSIQKRREPLLVIMRGQNFHISSDYWQFRDHDHFSKFVEGVWKYVRDTMHEEPILVVVDERGAAALELKDIF